MNRYEVRPTNQLRVECPDNPHECTIHCHWMVYDTQKQRAVGYLFNDNIALLLTDILNVGVPA